MPFMYNRRPIQNHPIITRYHTMKNSFKQPVTFLSLAISLMAFLPMHAAASCTDSYFCSSLVRYQLKLKAAARMFGRVIQEATSSEDVLARLDADRLPRDLNPDLAIRIALPLIKDGRHAQARAILTLINFKGGAIDSADVLLIVELLTAINSLRAPSYLRERINFVCANDARKDQIRPYLSDITKSFLDHACTSATDTAASAEEAQARSRFNLAGLMAGLGGLGAPCQPVDTKDDGDVLEF
jgi:hypothetical protein